MIPNILAHRYASSELKSYWSPEAKIIIERTFWIAVLKAQRDLGLDIPQEAIDAYEREKENVNLPSIEQREINTRHDVKAKIDEFCALAGYQHIHKGLTSRDLTENVEQLQVFCSLQHLREKSVAILAALARIADEYKNLVITARTHNVPAQTTTFGKRIAMYGEEFLRAIEKLDQLIETYPFRGVKGAVGTQLDLIHLFNGDIPKAEELNTKILGYLEAPQAFNAVGQVYPRSLDFEVVSTLYQLSSGPANFSNTLRLMAGHELASEGFADGQVGSSAMPHKMNTRSCERIRGFQTILKGYLTMASEIAGDQWNEGDVSCSVVRRVLLPDSCFAIDGLLETFSTILNQMELYPEVIKKENEHYLPFLMTTQFLMEAIKSGIGREEAHEAIKEHAIKTAQALRSGEITSNDLCLRLAKDPRVGLKIHQLHQILEQGYERTGAAQKQVLAFIEKANPWKLKFPEAAKYKPEPIL